MKNLIVIFLFLLMASCESTNKPIDKNIKTLKTVYYDIQTDSLGKIKESYRRKDCGDFLELYDQSGNLLEIQYFDSSKICWIEKYYYENKLLTKKTSIRDGIEKTQSIYKYEFDSQGNKNKCLILDKDGELNYSEIFNRNGNNIKCISYSNGFEFRIDFYKYDADGNKLEWTCENIGSSWSSYNYKTIYFYNANNNLVEERVYDSNFNQSSRTLYKYNHNNDCIEYDSGFSFNYKTNYVYDKYDNWVERTRNSTLVKREIEYY